MAIIGTLEEVKTQLNTTESFAKALTFLETEELNQYFEKVTEGNPVKVDIDGEKVFAMFQMYSTKELDVPVFEGHKRYADIQYVHEGEEFAHFTSITNVTEQNSYDADSDFYLLKVSSYSSALLQKKSVAVFFPEDMHSPCNSTDKVRTVKKIVFKIEL